MIRTYTCQQCNNEFTRQWWPSYDKPGQTNKFKFCGYDCAKKSRVKKVKIDCLQCGNEVECWPARQNTRKFCNRACKGRWHGEQNKGVIVNKTGIPWNKGKKFPHMQGANNPRWNGGVSGERQKDMGSLEYKSWRSAVFERDNYTCQMCDQYGGSLHADHIKGWKEFPELRHAVDNGRTLCVPCHYYVTFKKKMPTTSNWGKTNRLRRLQ